MKRIRNTIALLAMFAVAAGIELSCTSKAPEAPKSTEATQSSASACAFPTAMAASNEQTAWQLFVAASCPDNGKLKWETWTEQTCWLQPATPGCGPTAGLAGAAPVRHLHASGLAVKLRGLATTLGATPGNCTPMTTAATGSKTPPSLIPFVPKNLAANPEFCEEVFANPSEASFVNAPAAGATLTNLTAQVAYAHSTPDGIGFPVPSVEVKADWLPAKSLNPTFSCTTNPPDGVYVENITTAGVPECYALVGIHVSSKLLTNWLWATFEPQNTVTNPNRCKPDLYTSCNDPWGSEPAASTGQTTAQTAALTTLMNGAGLAKQFLNYRLVAAQSTYVDASNKPIHLGNSFVEFNAGVLPHEASCMTCHSYALVSAAYKENSPGTKPHVGTPIKPPGTWISQDFSWILGSMPASPPQKK